MAQPAAEPKPAKTKSKSTTKVLDEVTEARVQALADSVKHAPDLRSLHRALLAICTADDGNLAFQRINLANLRRFDGAKKPGNDGAISWDRDNALVLGEEGLEASRIVERVDAPKNGPEVAPKLRVVERQEPQEADGDAPANDAPATGGEGEATPEPEPVDPEALTALLRGHLEGAGFTVGACRVTVRSSGVRFKLAATYRGRKERSVELPWPAQAQGGEGLREFLEAMVEGLQCEE